MNNEWTDTNHNVPQRFEVRIGDQLAVLNYRIDGSRVTYFHAASRHGVYSLERRDLK
jgi:hypothetical protein